MSDEDREDQGTEETGTEDQGTETVEIDQEGEDTRLSSARREAARHRTERNEAREERDTARGALDSARRGHAESLALGHLAVTSDLWMDGASVADVLDDEGNVDPAKVTELASRQVKARPGLAGSLNRQHRAGGHGNNRPAHTTIDSWSGAAKASNGRTQSVYNQ